jgi:ABC-2 type transport system ATP-binding protein
LLLDEPTAALDPDIADEIRAFVREQKNEHGISIIFTSHNMDEVTEVCDRVLVMKKGSVIAQGTPSSLAATVSCARVQFATDQGELFVSFAQEKGFKAIISERSVFIEMNEQAVAPFLIELTKRALSYYQISIEKPDLTDYFIEMAKGA